MLPRLKLVRFLFKGNIRTKRSPKGFFALANSLISRGEFSFMFLLPYRAIFVWPWKMVLASVRYLFYQPMDEKIKTWTLRFPAKENPNMEKALFDWPIVLQYDVKAKYRLISRKFSGMKFFHPSVRLTNQKPRAFVSVRWTNQIALFPFVCCFCFVRAFSFQGHTKIALWLHSVTSFFQSYSLSFSVYCISFHSLLFLR